VYPRHEDRREAILIKANSIGTTALRARLLPAPHNTESLKLLKDYVQVRLDIKKSYGNKRRPWRLSIIGWCPLAIDAFAE
jgi:hypothetical protein